jgi:deoxyribonuclease-4
MARRLEAIDRLWEAIGAASGGDTVGFCLDTCHAWAGGADLTDVVERVRAITGRIDLVHANDSRDAFDSGADRHTNFGSGTIDGDALAAVVRAAGAPVVVETPGGVEGQTADIAWLRDRV